MNLKTQKLLELYGGPAPRYTSYPPATQFRRVESKNALRHSLERLQMNQKISLYLHIPFCRSLCSYCGCTTRVVQGDSPIMDYVGLLEKEIILVARALNQRLTVSHIHFGGGSPNLLKKEDLLLILGEIDKNFLVEDDAEIAMEIDPRQMTQQKARDYVRAGINRVSLGVQDFQEKTQSAINRIQPYSQIEACVFWLRDEGITGINFDLMYGLPYQTVESIADNIEKALILEPARIALFGYAHVPWMKPHQKILEKYAMPDSIERFAQAERARKILLERGYAAIGMDHFSKANDPLAKACESGLLKRNFQGYTNDTSPVLLGFGLSAISRFPEAYIQSTSSFSDYKKCIENKEFADSRWIHISHEDRVRGEIIEQLMCFSEVDCEKICKEHGFPEDYFDLDIQKLVTMEKEQLVMLKTRRVKVTHTGMPFIRRVCACFDQYYKLEEERHARVI